MSRARMESRVDYYETPPPGAPCYRCGSRITWVKSDDCGRRLAFGCVNCHPLSPPPGLAGKADEGRE